MFLFKYEFNFSEKKHFPYTNKLVKSVIGENQERLQRATLGGVKTLIFCLIGDKAIEIFRELEGFRIAYKLFETNWKIFVEFQRYGRGNYPPLIAP